MTEKVLVTPAELSSMLPSDDIVLIDTRDPATYAAGHLPGAVNIHDIFTYLATSTPEGVAAMREKFAAVFGAAGLSGKETAVVYEQSMNSGFGQSCRGYVLLTYLGYPKVAILHGGYAAWTKAGGEVSKEPVTAEAGDFSAEFRPELLADVKEVQDAIAGDTNLIDARSVAQFIGKEKTNTVQALGTVPTSVNINFDKFYHPEKPGFASAEEIAALTKTASVTDDKGLITFCNTGHLASIAWFGLSEVEGLKNVRLYDGSMSQWTADASRPVVAQ